MTVTSDIQTNIDINIDQYKHVIPDTRILLWLHAYMDYLCTREVKRSYRGNNIPDADYKRICKSINQEDGENMTSYIERTGLSFGKPDRVKQCTGVVIDLEGGPVNVYVGSQFAPEESVTWEGPFSFDPSTDNEVNCRVSGKYLAFKVESTTDVAWTLTRYEMILRDAGSQ